MPLFTPPSSNFVNPAPLAMMPESGAFFCSRLISNLSANIAFNAAALENLIYFIPLTVARTVNIDAMALWVTAVAGASIARFGLYLANPANRYLPGQLFIQSPVAVTFANTGFGNPSVLTSPVTLVPYQLYWTAVAMTRNASSPQARASGTQTDFGWLGMSAAAIAVPAQNKILKMVHDPSAAALPAFAVPVIDNNAAFANQGPLLFLRAL